MPRFMNISLDEIPAGYTPDEPDTAEDAARVSIAGDCHPAAYAGLAWEYAQNVYQQARTRTA